jgi:carbon-monoxide dehydrogenase medium subunit
LIPAAFDYHAPKTLRQAVNVLRRYDGDARVLAGGQSLIPMMKLRLANLGAVVDLHRIDGLASVEPADSGLAIGPMTTHYALETSALVRERAPLLADAAAMVGDVQVRNRGTIGGAIAHADPAADYPAVLLALEATFRVAGGARRRTVRAERMFVDAYTTALGESEILAEIAIPQAPARTGWSYQKLANRASRFAVVGVAALVTLADDGMCERVRVGVTGAGPFASRAKAAERYLVGRAVTEESIAKAAARAAKGIEFLGDVHGSPAYREHLTMELTKRALTEAAGRAR